MQHNDTADHYGRAPLRMKFTPEEDHRLREIVRSFVSPNWVHVAALMGNRTPRQCRERYRNYLAPQIVNGRWTEEEEKLLERLFDEMGPKWSKMALNFPTRSDVNLKNHWSAMLHRKCRAGREADSHKLATESIEKETKTPIVIEDLLSKPTKPIVSLPDVSTFLGAAGRKLPMFDLPIRRSGALLQDNVRTTMPKIDQRA